MENGINNLDASKHIVTYCYTGQTSAVITAFLNVLGYNASSLLFGMNGLWNDSPTWSTTVNQWGGDSNPKDLPLVQ
jgi:3-mercaptopyruvate sulfurtransferase SseA